jgi:hypothetical protein
VAGRQAISVSDPESGLDDGDVILAPTREDVRAALKAVAGGPPILFGASAGAARWAASRISPGLKDESRRLKSRSGWLSALTALSPAAAGVGGAVLLASKVPISVAGAVLGILGSYLLSVFFFNHPEKVASGSHHKVEVQIRRPTKPISKPGSSEDAEAASSKEE